MKNKDNFKGENFVSFHMLIAYIIPKYFTICMLFKSVNNIQLHVRYISMFASIDVLNVCTNCIRILSIMCLVLYKYNLKVTNEHIQNSSCRVWKTNFYIPIRSSPCKLDVSVPWLIPLVVMSLFSLLSWSSCPSLWKLVPAIIWRFCYN